MNLQNLIERYDEDDEKDLEQDNNEDEDSGEVAEINSAIPRTNSKKIIHVPNLKQAVRSVRFLIDREPYANSNMFHNLTIVAVAFAETCTYLEEENERKFYLTTAEDNHGYRTAVLKELFRSLNDPRYPMPSLTTLSLKNLQNVDNASLTSSKDFLAVLKRIINLPMRMIVEYKKATSESSWSLHLCMISLPSCLPLR
ncbi:hypothetical protein EAE96_008635 [Botrytis aclada]|nr:hypothetical protein EAE96_008635 [Botrytis aclada]